MNADFQLHLSEKVGALPLSDEDKKRVIDIAFWAMEQVAQPKAPAVLCANCGMPIGQHAEDGLCTSPGNDDLSPYWRPSGVTGAAKLTGESVLDLVRDYGAIMGREAVAESGQRKRDVQGEAMVAMQRIVDALARAEVNRWKTCARPTIEQVLNCADAYGDARIMASKGRVDRSEVDEARKELRAMVERAISVAVPLEAKAK